MTPMPDQPNTPPAILIVDDNPVNINLLSTMLSAMGIDPLTATNGLQAVELARNSKLDLILMDLQMPLRDGYQAAALIRAEDGLHQPRIVAVTATLWGEEKADTQLLPFDEIIFKPVDFATLEQSIDRWLTVPYQAISEVSHPPLTSQTTGDPLPALDETALQQLLNQYPQQRREQLTELVTLFLESSEQILRNLKHAVENNDLKTVERNAHALKSSSGNLAAITLMETCAELERDCPSLTVTQQQALLARLLEQYFAVKTALLTLTNT